MPLLSALPSLLMLCLLTLGNAWAAAPAAKPNAAPSEPTWPQVISSGKSKLTVYQPQLDSWDGYTLNARAAVEATAADGKSTYGIVQFSAHTLVDKTTRWVALDQYKIIEADFPADAKQANTWLAILEKDAESRKKTISLDQLEAAVGVLNAEQKADSAPLENTPPIIISSDSPAILVYIDGEAAYRPVEGTELQRVINTRPLLLKDAEGKHYLHVFDGWMVADQLAGDYTRLAAPPASLEKAKQAAIKSRQVDLLTGQSDPKDKIPSLAKPPQPKIFIATAPTELLVTDGAAQWQPIQGTSLLYVSNTTGHIFKEIGDQNSYVLISGRWFRASDMSGPWTFVPADKLPADFAKIPDDSAKENVKASVAGTPQAQEAVIAATIPQTSAIRKSAVKMTAPQFDGEPQLKAISNTPLQYVINSATPIIRVDNDSWWAVENGIWFSATSLNGPWSVATSVPAVIYSIPPSSPMHYLTYVKVYESSGDTVVVGYTPGYQGSTLDPATGVVVYGTGYPYTPWVGSVWYGPPVTYGFGVAIRYTPWTGWSFGFGFGWSWGSSTVAMGWGWGAYPCWEITAGATRGAHVCTRRRWPGVAQPMVIAAAPWPGVRVAGPERPATFIISGVIARRSAVMAPATTPGPAIAGPVRSAPRTTRVPALPPPGNVARCTTPTPATSLLGAVVWLSARTVVPSPENGLLPATSATGLMSVPTAVLSTTPIPATPRNTEVSMATTAAPRASATTFMPGATATFTRKPTTAGSPWPAALPTGPDPRTPMRSCRISTANPPHVISVISARTTSIILHK